MFRKCGAKGLRSGKYRRKSNCRENSAVREKIAEIIQNIEKADELFKEIETDRVEARTLWDSGIERLTAAIWICERTDDETEKDS